MTKAEQDITILASAGVIFAQTSYPYGYYYGWRETEDLRSKDNFRAELDAFRAKHGEKAMDAVVRLGAFYWLLSQQPKTFFAEMAGESKITQTYRDCLVCLFGIPEDEIPL